MYTVGCFVFFQPPAKRRRTNVSASQKHAICREKTARPNASAQDLVNWAKENLGIDVGKSTMCDFIRSKEKWLDIDSDSTQTRQRFSHVPQREEVIFLWLSCCKKLRHLGSRLNVSSNFAYS